MRHAGLPCLLLLALLAMTGQRAVAQPCLQPACAPYFPPDAGALNVRDYGAKGDGRTDDTAAILQAVAASGGDTGMQIWRDRLIFFPAGTYLVSGTIMKHYADRRFGSGMGLVGQGADRTIIKLIDHAAGFDNPSAPRGVIMTTSKKIDRANNRDYAHLGEGNDAYENFVESMTIDVGKDNPGAIGIDYLGNNIGAVRDVLIRAPDGSGAMGLSLLRKIPGPALVQRVEVRGFDIGINLSGSEYGMTFSQVRLAGQKKIGFRNAGNSVSADRLDIAESDATALLNTSESGLVVLAGGRLQSASGTVIDNAGTVVFRSVRFAVAPTPGPTLQGGTATGWLVGRSEWHSQTLAWTLPLPATPIVDPGPSRHWAGVDGQPDDDPPADATERLQTAVNSGASTIYLRHGMFRISAPILIPPTVHRIMGMNSTITLVPHRPGAFPPNFGLFRILQPGPPLLIDHLAMDMSNRGRQVGVELSANRQLVLRDVFGAGLTTLDRRTGGGEAFLDDTAGGGFSLAGSREVIARQLNTEGNGIRIANHGAPLAIVGIKTEGDCTVEESEFGAHTEIFGGLIYVVAAAPKPEIAAFVTKDSEFAASFVEEVNLPDRHYATLLADTQNLQTHDVAEETMPKRNLGRLIPLLTAGIPQPHSNGPDETVKHAPNK